MMRLTGNVCVVCTFDRNAILWVAIGGVVEAMGESP